MASIFKSIDQVRLIATPFIEFLNKTGSPYHSVLAVKSILDLAGFQQLDERNPWNIEAGKKYYITRNNSCLGAFIVGKNVKLGKGGFCIVATHTDSPCLRIRPNADITKENFKQVGVECYGGGLWHTWFDRGLGVCGKVIVRNETNNTLQERFVRINKPILYIPNLAIHLQSAEDIAAFKVNKELHLQPILHTDEFNKMCGGEATDEPEDSSSAYTPSSSIPRVLRQLIAGDLAVKPDEVLEWDLCLFEATDARFCGIHDEFIESGRLDNQFSTFAAFTALSKIDESTIENSSDIHVAVAFDHEEVGSESFTGANSSVLETWLNRILKPIGLGDCKDEFMARSFLISADMAHAVHPNYADVHQNQHKPELHKGVVFKENCNQRYTSHASTLALMRKIATRCFIPTQNFCVKNSSRCGSTVGPMLSARLGIRSIDVGAPQLAMHSCRELCGTIDLKYMISFLECFYRHFRSMDANFETKL